MDAQHYADQPTGNEENVFRHLLAWYCIRTGTVLYGLAGGIIPTAEMLIDQIWLYVRVYTMRRIQVHVSWHSIDWKEKFGLS